MFFTFVFTIVLAVAQQSLKIDYKYITLPQWGPGIAALVLSFVLYKNILDKSIKLHGISTLKLLLCFVIPIGVMGIGYLIGKVLGFVPANSEKISIQFLCVFVPFSFIGAVGEELGWRSFLQSSLDGRLNSLIASILVGTLWGLWHIGHYKNGIIFMALFLIFTISSSIIIAYLIRGLHYNLLLAAIFHFSINIGFFLFFRGSVNDIKMMLINALVWLCGVSFVVLPKMKNQVYTHKV